MEKLRFSFESVIKHVCLPVPFTHGIKWTCNVSTRSFAHLPVSFMSENTQHNFMKLGIWGSIHPSIQWRYSPYRALASSMRFRNNSFFYGVGLLAPRPTPNLEDQVSIFVQLYPRALGSSGTSGVPLSVPTIVGPWGVWGLIKIVSVIWILSMSVQ
jgi:hypothetical protein